MSFSFVSGGYVFFFSSRRRHTRWRISDWSSDVCSSDLSEHARRVASGELGRIRVGMINYAPFHPLIPQVIREFRRRYPDVAFSLEERTTPGLVAAVRGDAVDVAFVRPIHGSADTTSIEPVTDYDTNGKGMFMKRL